MYHKKECLILKNNDEILRLILRIVTLNNMTLKNILNEIDNLKSFINEKFK